MKSFVIRQDLVLRRNNELRSGTNQSGVNGFNACSGTEREPPLNAFKDLVC